MKSYNHLWEKYLTEENARKAITDMAKGKSKNRNVAKILEDVESYIPVALADAERYEPRKHHVKEIYDGIQRKKRTIVIPRANEQVVHHMIVNVLAPILRKSMYEHSYASLPGGGIHNGARLVRKWLKHDRKNTKYFLKLDIKSYFASIDREILYKMLKKKIHDARFLGVLRDVIMTPEGTGIPLGFYTSQWLANFYLTGLDHYIKNTLKARYYIRYMDDMVIFGSSKRKLWKVFDGIREYLRGLKLTLKGSYQLARFQYCRSGKTYGRFLDFLGFRFYRDHTAMRRKIMLKISRKAKMVAAKERPTAYDARQLLSLYGWLRHTDSHRFMVSRINPYISTKRLKEAITRHTKGGMCNAVAGISQRRCQQAGCSPV